MSQQQRMLFSSVDLTKDTIITSLLDFIWICDWYAQIFIDSLSAARWKKNQDFAVASPYAHPPGDENHVTGVVVEILNLFANS